MLLRIFGPGFGELKRLAVIAMCRKAVCDGSDFHDATVEGCRKSLGDFQASCSARIPEWDLRFEPQPSRGR